MRSPGWILIAFFVLLGVVCLCLGLAQQADREKAHTTTYAEAYEAGYKAGFAVGAEGVALGNLIVDVHVLPDGKKLFNIVRMDDVCIEVLATTALGTFTGRATTLEAAAGVARCNMQVHKERTNGKAKTPAKRVGPSKHVDPAHLEQDASGPKAA